jgi:hypothetical protein
MEISKNDFTRSDPRRQVVGAMSFLASKCGRQNVRVSMPSPKVCSCILIDRSSNLVVYSISIDSGPNQIFGPIPGNVFGPSFTFASVFYGMVINRHMEVAVERQKVERSFVLWIRSLRNRNVRSRVYFRNVGTCTPRRGKIAVAVEVMDPRPNPCGRRSLETEVGRTHKEPL